MKLCDDCKWRETVGFETFHCFNPEITTVNVVTGFLEPDCFTLRAGGGKCGPEGKYWERALVPLGMGPAVILAVLGLEGVGIWLVATVNELLRTWPFWYNHVEWLWHHPWSN